jgi:hypothetical protein
MREPNFSESQLQQATNTAFIRRILEVQGVWTFAHVPSLIAEFDLGWDTAFLFPWLSHAPSIDDEGCNFFVQYKLSGELTSAGAKEWSTWNNPYFRFKIPHSTRSPSGLFIDDYHQWDRLKALATKGFPTFYATNATLQKADIQRQLSAGTLLDYIPLLDVRAVNAQHKHVTFTPSSSKFSLHSEKEDAGKLTFSQGLAKVSESEQFTLRSSISHLVAALLELPDENGWSSDVDRVSRPAIDGLSDAFNEMRRYMQLMYLVQKHLGALLLWLPKRVKFA